MILSSSSLLFFLLLDAILCVGVRFNVADVTGTLGSPQCKSETRLTTNEKSTSYQDTISAVIGSRFFAGLCPFYINLSSFIQSGTQRVNRDVKTDDPPTAQTQWRIEGLVSKAPNSILGDNIAREIQLFCLNGRPVELPKLSRTILDTWKLYDGLANTVVDDSMRKRPACILGIYLPSYMIDVNVSPDKREVFIVDEDNLYRAIKDELSNLWSDQMEGVFKMNEVSSTINKKRSIEESHPTISCVATDPDDGFGSKPNHKSRELMCLQKSKLQFSSSKTGNLTDEIMLLDSFNHIESDGHRNENVKVTPNHERSSITQENAVAKDTVSIGSITAHTLNEDSVEDEDIEMLHRDDYNVKSSMDNQEIVAGPNDPSDDVKSRYFSQNNPSSPRRADDELDFNKVQNFGKIFSFGGTNAVIDQYRKARLSMKRVRRHLATLLGNLNASAESTPFTSHSDHQDETISLSKSDFRNMVVVGQYNLGFILALCPMKHLWILDQV